MILYFKYNLNVNFDVRLKNYVHLYSLQKKIITTPHVGVQLNYCSCIGIQMHNTCNCYLLYRPFYNFYTMTLSILILCIPERFYSKSL